MPETAERIAAMKRENAEAKAILDRVIIHPNDTEGRKMLEQQLANNRALADLLDKMETAFQGADESR